jgi:hypothetical protein
METFMGEILSGQSFVVVILVGAVIALWRSTQDGNKKLIEIIENNTKTQQELRGVIEKTSNTTDAAFNMIRGEIIDHNREVLSKLDLLIKMQTKVPK